MKISIKSLSVILLAQLALIAYLQTQSSSTAAFKKTQNLLAVNFDDVNQVEIFDADKKKITLKEDAGKWNLPELKGFPVSSKKIEEFLTKVKEAKRSWPVGKTLSSAKQFSVVDEQFERKLVFSKNGDVKSTLFVGTSPSFRKVHVRVDGEDLTYTMELNTYELPTKMSHWFDKDLYRLEKSKTEEILFKDFSLQNKEGDFVLAELGQDEQMDKAKTKTLSSLAVHPTFEDVLDFSQKSLSLASGVFQYSVRMKSGESIVFDFSEYRQNLKEENKKNKEEIAKDFLALKVSSTPYYFKVRKSRIEQLLKPLAQKSPYH
mgnify:CR=1 FL=1